ncbi:MAG: acetate/propionate family kinase [bacterium]
MNKEEIKQFLATKVELFHNFPEDKLTELIEGSHLTTFEGNEAVIEFGEIGRFLGILIEGEAEASVTDDAGEKYRIALLKSGDIFGEISLMTGDRTTADIIGISRCKALFIPHDLFSRLLITYPPAVMYLSRLLSERSKIWTKDESGRDLIAAALKKSDDPYGFKLKTDTPAKLLVINCGSSSLKYHLFDTGNEQFNIKGNIENIGSSGIIQNSCRDHKEAFSIMLSQLTSSGNTGISSPSEITAVGHRVVHGGSEFTSSVIIDDKVINIIEKVSHLAPLHNPINLVGIKEAMQAFPEAFHVAVFDTSFHHTLPPYAYLFGLPYELYKEEGIRRYGFHGMSHLYVSLKAAEVLKRSFNSLEIISCHLGNGASMCAIDHGRSVDTTMGMTPTAGLIMGTRCGDVDPGVLTHLMKSKQMSVDDLNTLINNKSGLKGLSGISHDMRDIEQKAQEGHHRSLLAYKSFCYQVRKCIGAYVAAMQGLDVLIFTGGIGMGSPGVRSLACQGLECMGIIIDEKKNREAEGKNLVYDISTDIASVRVLVIPTDEERMIARETIRTVKKKDISILLNKQEPLPVPIEVSAHHVHLCPAHVAALFGPGHQLTPVTDLSQPGQYACEEKVTLIGPKGKVERVRVLGPPRKETQVEISMTEQFKLGIHPPIRESGDLENTPGITIEGTYGSIKIEKGVICAMRHIHMSPQNALQFGLRDKYIVRVSVEGDRELIFGDVLIRVNPDYNLAMHIDTDEANAANISSNVVGYIDGIQSRN